MAAKYPSPSRVTPSAADMHRARLAHLDRVAKSRAKLEAFNLKAERKRALAIERALQKAATYFLEPGTALASPAVLDLVRWPYAGEQKLIYNVPTALRDSILAEDAICVWCRKAQSTTIDHVRPRSRGGSNHPLNLVGACEPCNSTKYIFLPKEIGWVLHLPRRAFALSTVNQEG